MAITLTLHDCRSHPIPLEEAVAVYWIDDATGEIEQVLLGAVQVDPDHHDNRIFVDDTDEPVAEWLARDTPEDWDGPLLGDHPTHWCHLYRCDRQRYEESNR